MGQESQCVCAGEVRQTMHPHPVFPNLVLQCRSVSPADVRIADQRTNIFMPEQISITINSPTQVRPTK